MKALAVALLALGLVLSVTVIPGVFTVDDNNYLINVLALRHARLTVGNTEGLSPSRELFAFDPGPWDRAAISTPVASSAPPLYALLALPFSWLGWRGLVGLNTIAYLITIALVFGYARRHAMEASTPWLAAAAFGLGGFAIEYAQGVWPHALSIALSTAGIAAAGRALEEPEERRATFAAAAGLLLALATGVRYQNVVILAITGGCLVLWAADRWKVLAMYALAGAVPMCASAYINHVRLDSWNPISKGEGYLNVPTISDGSLSLFDPLTMFWARVVDFSVRPPLVGPNFSWVVYEPSTGAHLMNGTTLQKAFLQSTPWAVLAFIVFTLAWMPRFAMPPAHRRHLRLFSVISAAVLLTFSFAGVRRNEGLSFNQRYLLELLPLAAIGFAWALDGLRLSLRPLVAGALWGLVIVALCLNVVPLAGSPETTHWLGKHWVILKLPLLFAAGLGTLWFFARHKKHAGKAAAMAGLCLGWGFALHVGDDVVASHQLRARKLAETGNLRNLLTDGSAYIAYSGNKDAAFPLLFDRDLVILDARGDEGADAPLLIRELLDRKRRVFVLRSGFPDATLARVLDGWELVRVSYPGVDLVELRARPD